MAGFNPWYANWAQEQVAQGKVPTMEDGAKAYLESEEVQKKIADAIMGSIDMKQATEALQTQLQQQLSAKMQQAVPAMAQALESQLQASITTAMSSYMQNVLGAYMQQMQTALETQVSAAMQQSMNQIAANMSNACLLYTSQRGEAHEQEEQRAPQLPHRHLAEHAGTVSYTHLDVYKRQRACNAPTAIPTPRPWPSSMRAPRQTTGCHRG